MGLAKMENILDGINSRLYTGGKKFYWTWIHSNKNYPKSQREKELNKSNRASVICGTIFSSVTSVKMESQKRQGNR